MNWILILIIILIVILIFIIYNKSYSNIPKIIHQTYPTKNVNKDIQNNIDTLKRLNPGYEYRLYDDRDIVNFIKNNYDDYILETYNKINPEYGPARTDYFRYLLLYKQGGIYLDIKSSCEKPFDSIIKKDDEFILNHWGNYAHWSQVLKYSKGEFCNWNIIIKKKHPLMKKIINKVTFNINNYSLQEYKVGKLGVLFLTGPIPFSQTILENKNNYNLTIYDNYNNIGLIYNNLPVSHENIFKKHYTKLKTPIVLKNNNIT